MNAVVLVGGEGTRLRPLTYRIPKQLLPVVEIPMLVRLLGALERFGVADVVLSMGYQPDAFRAAFPDGRCGGIALDYAVEPEPLDTGGGIAFAARHARIHETFLVVNGDVLHDFDLAALVEVHEARGAEATIALTPVADPSDFGLVVSDDDGKVSAFVEKGEPRRGAIGNRINAGIYVFEPTMLDRLPDGSRIHIETSVFPVMADEGVLYAREMPGWWIDVGNRERYLQATADLLASPAPAPGAAGGGGVWKLGTPTVEGVLQPPVLLADRARVGSGARVARSVVGAGAIVGPEAVVEDSVLMTGADVGVGAVVRRSIIGPGESVPGGATVEDSIVAREGING